MLKVSATLWYDLISGMEWEAGEDVLTVNILPYDVFWLKPDSEMAVRVST